MKKHLLFGLSLCLFTLTTEAQKHPIPITISAFNEATAIPFTKILSTPAHPGVQLGTGFFYRQAKKTNQFQAFNIGYIFHRKLYHGFFVNTEFGYDYKLNFGMNLKGAIGLGYLITFNTQKEYQFQNGSYISKKDKGNSRIMASISTGLGYRLQKKNQYSPEIFVMYQGWAEYPYSPGFIPVMAHTNLHLGTKFFIH